MKWKRKDILFSVWILLFTMLVGCSTKKLINQENAYAGYIYALSQQGNTKYNKTDVDDELKKYTMLIASEEFDRRNEEYLGIHTDKSLARMKDYIEELETWITLEADQWQVASISLSKKERKAATVYWEANQPIRFDGAKALPDWEQALATATLQLTIDTENAEELENRIDDLNAENRFREAVEIVQELRPYKPELADKLYLKMNENASAYWVGQRMLDLKELRSAEDYDAAHEQQILELFSAINKDAADFKCRDDFRGVYMNWQDLLGENWRRQIEEMGELKEYWWAYEIARERYGRDYGDSFREGLRFRIGKGYQAILDNAIRYYSDLALNAHNGEGHDGKAYVYCCMAKEMYDFNTFANFPYYEEAEEWYEDISSLEKEALIPSLESDLARRLVIYEFKRGQADDLGLSDKLRQSSLVKYALGNDRAWGLEVITDKKVLEEFEDGSLPVKSDDYVVEWTDTEFYLKKKDVSITTENVYVGTGRSRLVDNPDRKDKTSKFYKEKQIQAQEVDLYTATIATTGVKIKCTMDALCRFRGREDALELSKTKETLRIANAGYESVTNTTYKFSHSNVESEYYLPAATIVSDPIPKNDNEHALPTEEKLKQLLGDSVIEDLEGELSSIIDMYPIELLGDADHDGSNEYLDSLGTVLFYIVNLSITDAAEQELAGKGYKWLHLRDQIVDNTKQWCEDGERWGSAQWDDNVWAAEKEIMKRLWEECTLVGSKQSGF